MASQRWGIRSEEAQQQSRHRLFVEGIDTSVDRSTIEYLLEDISIRIEPLGPAYSIKDAADALHPHHPDYYFLIDRDHHHDDFVQACWDNFPDPGKSNLLVWPRRELENYFLIPDYLSKSAHKTKNKTDLKKCILKHAKKRLYLDAVNITITELRETLKGNWIQILKNPEDISTKDAAIRKLKGLNEFNNHITQTNDTLKISNIIKLFENTLKSLLGGKNTPQFGHGNWLEILRGKHILRAVLSECFQVKDRDGNVLQGPQQMKYVLKQLVQLDLKEQPDDFQRLHEVIAGQVGQA
jgi:hypothetical protein